MCHHSPTLLLRLFLKQEFGNRLNLFELNIFDGIVFVLMAPKNSHNLFLHDLFVNKKYYPKNVAIFNYPLPVHYMHIVVEYW